MLTVPVTDDMYIKMDLDIFSLLGRLNILKQQREEEESCQDEKGLH